MSSTRWLLIGLLVGGLLAEAAPASAQSSAHAAQAPDATAANRLARRAVYLLSEAEETTRDDIKRRLYTEGERLAERAIALDATNANAHWALFANRGRLMEIDGIGLDPVVLWKLNRQLDRCLELDPEHYDALVVRGGSYRRLPRLLGGDLRKAEEVLTRALKLNPYAVGGRLELARTYLDMKEPDKAKGLLIDAAYWAEREGKEKDLTEARVLLLQLDERGVLTPQTCAAPGPRLTVAAQAFSNKP